LSIGKIPPHFSPKEKQKVIRKNAKYSWMGGDLFYSGVDLIIRSCVREDEMKEILNVCHNESYGGHFLDKRTTYKILFLG
jgi:hypothetical protein